MVDTYARRRRNRMNYNKNKSCVKRLHRLYNLLQVFYETPMNMK